MSNSDAARLGTRDETALLNHFIKAYVGRVETETMAEDRFWQCLEH